MNPTEPMPEGKEYFDDGDRRTENDLDSITVGSPSKSQVKIYFNSKKDTQDELEIRVSWVVNCATYLQSQMEKAGLK